MLRDTKFVWMVCLVLLCQCVSGPAFASRALGQCSIFRPSSPEDLRRRQEFDLALTAELAKLQRYALKLTRNKANAEDLVQRTVERALQKADLFEPGSNMTAWLTTILTRLNINDSRVAKARARYGENVDLDAVSHLVSVRENQADTVEFKQVLRQLELLPEDQRQAVILAMNGLSYEEIADHQGILMGTVKSRLGRGRARLRERGIEGHQGTTYSTGLRIPSPRATSPAKLPSLPVALRRPMAPPHLAPALEPIEPITPEPIVPAPIPISEVEMDGAHSVLIQTLREQPGIYLSPEALIVKIWLPESLAHVLPFFDYDVLEQLVNETIAKFKSVDPSFDHIEGDLERGYRWLP